ncbi:MAG TPA: cupin-like domain-containing protein [Polyangiaceae bacterium]
MTREALPPASVDEMRELDARAFRERYEARDRPLVIRGGARGFRAFERWNPEYLREKVGTVRVQHKLSVTNKHPDFDQPSLDVAFARGESTLGELFDAVTSGPGAERAKRLFTGDERFLLRRRAGVTERDPELGALWDDVTLPAVVPDERLYTAWAWFSGRGVRTWLHYDNNGCHNANAQITGRKECLLFDPSAASELYFFEPGGPNPAHNCSAVDVDAPDSERFPRFLDVRPWRATLEAGDLLFIPAWWPHAFFHDGEFNANVNFWWTPDAPRDNEVARRQARIERT